jgi:hypothetical protein
MRAKATLLATVARQLTAAQSSNAPGLKYGVWPTPRDPRHFPGERNAPQSETQPRNHPSRDGYAPAL